MDVRDYNRKAWNRQVEKGNRWTVPVGPEVTAAARRGEWRLLLTPTIPVPGEWYPPLEGADVLCLASGGGQQGPVLAAAGAKVMVLDNSPRQLAHDREVAERDNLEITLLLGDMRDLSMLEDESFDLVFHPVSNTFIPDVHPVWREAFRVLRPGGVMLAGFTNPIIYLFDTEKEEEQGVLEVRYSLPYSDLESLPRETLEKWMAEDAPLEYSHTLEAQIGGQLEAGFLLAGFYEDRHPEGLLARYMPTFIATRAVKPVR